MPHPVSCGACNATFSIPDEVWEKRVDGQLATLKCRHCKAPIQVDGRSKRSSITSEASKGHRVFETPGSEDRKSSPEPSGIQAAPKIRNASLGEAARTETRKPAGATGAGASLKLQAPKATPMVAKVTSAGLTSSDWLAPKHAGAMAGAQNAERDRSAAQTDARAAARQAKKEDKPPTTSHRTLEGSGDSSQQKGKVDRYAVSSDKTANFPEEAAEKQLAHLASAKKALAPTATTTVELKASAATHDAELAATVHNRSPLVGSDGALAPKVEPVAAAPQNLAITPKHEGNSSQSRVQPETPKNLSGVNDAPITTVAAKPAVVVAKGGGPPPLRKMQTPAADHPSATTQGMPASPDTTAAQKGPKAGGPPPLPHQTISHDAPVLGNERVAEPREQAPRIHSPASMPVVAAVVIPSPTNRAVSIPPRQSDIAALLKIRTNFPKWLPFAVLGAIVLSVAGLAALSWTRGDTTAERPTLGTSSRPTSTNLENATASPIAKQNAATSAPSSSASDTRAASGAFASQFAQAAAQQRPTSRFDRDATVTALAAGFAKAAACHNRGDPTGAAMVTLSISPSGQVLSVTVAPPFATTFTAECIRNALVDVKCPPFQGAPGRLVHSISIH